MSKDSVDLVFIQTCCFTNHCRGSSDALCSSSDQDHFPHQTFSRRASSHFSVANFCDYNYSLDPRRPREDYAKSPSFTLRVGGWRRANVQGLKVWLSLACTACARAHSSVSMVTKRNVIRAAAGQLPEATALRAVFLGSRKFVVFFFSLEPLWRATR